MNDLSSHILDKVEASDDLLKWMNSDFLSSKNKVNSQVDAIKIL